MNNYLNKPFFLFGLFFLYIVLQYNLPRVIGDAVHFSRMRNNMLRLYVYNYPAPLRKKVINKVGQVVGQTGTALNLYIIDINGKYYSLSEEDRIIIETALSFLY